MGAAAAATARFEVELDADSSGTDQLATSLERLQSKLKADQKAVGELQAAMKNLGQGASVNIEQFKALQAQLASKKASVAATQGEFIGLGGTLANANKQAAAARSVQAKAREQKAAQAAEEQAAFKRMQDAAVKAQEIAQSQVSKLQEKAKEAAVKMVEKQRVEVGARQKAAHDAAVKAQEKASTEAAKLTKKTSQEAAGGINDLVGAVGGAGGPFGGLAGRAQQLASSLGSAGLAGAAILAAAAIAVIVSAAVVGLFALASFALGAADAARSAGLLREAATGSAAAGERLGGVVARLSGQIATPRAELEELALQLARTGLSGNALETSFRAIAVASAVMGSQAGSALQSIVERARMSKRFFATALDFKGTGVSLQDVGAAVAKRLGISVQAATAAIQNGQVKLADGLAALDDAVQKKLGGIAAKQMLAFPVQIAKAKEALTAMFAGVRIEGFLVALHAVLGLLDESSVTGQALKLVFETLLNPLFDAVASNAPLIKGFFQGLVIGALMFAISVLKVKNALSETFGGKTKSDILTLENAILAGKVAFVIIGGAVAALTILLGILAVAVALVALPFVLAGLAMYAVFSGIAEGVGWLIDLGSQAYDAIAGFDFAEAGKNLVRGFANSIASGAGIVATAAKALAQSALNAIVSTLIIHSPSQATGKLATYAVKGFSNEIEAGTPEVQDAMSDMVSLPAVPSPASSPGAGAAGGKPSGGISFTFGDLYLGAKKVLRDADLELELSDVFGRAAQRAGLA